MTVLLDILVFNIVLGTRIHSQIVYDIYIIIIRFQLIFLNQMLTLPSNNHGRCVEWSMYHDN